MSPDSVQIITSNYAKLSKNEKTVADHLLSHFDASIGLSVYELSDACGVSPAVPVRLAKKLGFAGYKELRLQLAQSRPLRNDLFLDLENGEPGNVKNAVEKVLRAEMDSILATIEQLDYSALEAGANMIANAKRLLLFGCSTSYVACTDTAIKLRKVGKTTFAADSADSAAAILSGFEKGDAVIAVSHSGETSAAVNILKLAKRLGFASLAVTTFPDSAVGRNADAVLCTQTRESPLHKIALTSRVSQLAMLDALFMAYYSTNYELCREKVDASSQFLSEIR